jgi:hypothetical protein
MSSCWNYQAQQAQQARRRSSSSSGAMGVISRRLGSEPQAGPISLMPSCWNYQAQQAQQARSSSSSSSGAMGVVSGRHVSSKTQKDYFFFYQSDKQGSNSDTKGFVVNIHTKT